MFLYHLNYSVTEQKVVTDNEQFNEINKQNSASINQKEAPELSPSKIQRIVSPTRPLWACKNACKIGGMNGYCVYYLCFECYNEKVNTTNSSLDRSMFF